MASSMREGHGKYLKLSVLDFLDQRMSHWRNGWKQLAAEFEEYSSTDVDKFEADGIKINQSSTKLLLRDWENRHGGCDIDYLKKCLLDMGRRDIVTDLEDHYKGMELVEPSSTKVSLPQCSEPFKMSRDPDRHVPSHWYPQCQPCPQEGQDIVIHGKLYTRDGKTLISPHQVSGFQVLPKEHVYASQQEHPVDQVWNHFNDMEHRHSDSPSSKRNSDPLQRRDICSQSRSSGSLNDIPKGQDSPKNLKKTQSELLTENSSAGPSTCTCNHKSASQERDERGREDDRNQGQGNYASLRSIDHGQAWSKEGQASPGHQYLLLSSEIQQDIQWCKKLCKILKRNGHRVHMLHEVRQNDLLRVFQKVDFVVVIYTENYKNEFQTPGTINNELFKLIQSEYKHNHNHGTNHRFIPVYDTTVIRALPDALLQCNRRESDYIVSLLGNTNRRPEYERHSSAPSRNGVGGAGRDNATPMGRNNNARSQSEPQIVRKFHTPPHQFKPNSTEKKESKPKFRWNKKNKKDK